MGVDIESLRKKAGSGSVVAQSILGICYLDGIDVNADYAEAFRFLSMAADQGVPRALVCLGRIHDEGLGVPRNPFEAIRLYTSAAKAGEFSAQVKLGRIYARGLGVSADPKLSLQWYSAAVAQAGTIADSEELEEAKAYVSAHIARLPETDSRKL